MTPVFCCAYLPPVSFFKLMVGARQVLIEQFDNYHKQTYRNRCVIATSNGAQALTVPVVRPDTPKQHMRDIRISDHGNWRHLHWNALASAYMNSPFFMYYEDDFRQIFERRQTFLVDFNMELLSVVSELTGLKTTFSLTESYTDSSDPAEVADFRGMADPESGPAMELKPYYQVFAQKLGFIPNLSIADLLFNLGPESLAYLKE